MEYHKEAVYKKDRVLLGRGPRDLQKKQQVVTNVTNPVEAELIKHLSNQVNELTEALDKKNTGKVFTAEEFDTELIKQIEQAIKETEIQFKEEISELNNKIKYLESEIRVKEATIVDKNEIIETLKISLLNKSEDDVIITDSKRPVMEEVFIDPTEKDAGKGMKSHIKLEDVESEEDIGNKVNKLKSLIGGLPKK